MRNSVLASVVLHLTALIVLLIDIPLWNSSIKKDKVVSAPVIVDISKVKIAPVTNLPAKKEDKKVKEELKQPQKKVNKVEAVKKTTPKKTETKPAAKKTTDKKEAKKVPNKKTTDKKTTAKTVEKPKTQEKKEPDKQVKKDTKTEDEKVKSLLASLDKMEREYEENKAKEAKSAPDDKTKGIKGGGLGNYRQELTMSEQDAISAKLSACWNVDAGVKGAADMIVEVRVILRRDASVEDVKITDEARYRSDPVFRSVAESAKRAVYVCEYKRDESPFKFLATKYPQNFDVWKTLILSFNPLNGGVR